MQVKPIVHGLVECLLVDGQNEVDVDQTVSVLVRQIQGMPGLSYALTVGLDVHPFPAANSKPARQKHIIKTVTGSPNLQHNWRENWFDATKLCKRFV